MDYVDHVMVTSLDCQLLSLTTSVLLTYTLYTFQIGWKRYTVSVAIIKFIWCDELIIGDFSRNYSVLTLSFLHQYHNSKCWKIKHNSGNYLCCNLFCCRRAVSAPQLSGDSDLSEDIETSVQAPTVIVREDSTTRGSVEERQLTDAMRAGSGEGNIHQFHLPTNKSMYKFLTFYLFTYRTDQYQ